MIAKLRIITIKTNKIVNFFSFNLNEIPRLNCRGISGFHLPNISFVLFKIKLQGYPHSKIIKESNPDKKTWFEINSLNLVPKIEKIFLNQKEELLWSYLIQFYEVYLKMIKISYFKREKEIGFGNFLLPFSEKITFQTHFWFFFRRIRKFAHFS